MNEFSVSPLVEQNGHFELSLVVLEPRSISPDFPVQGFVSVTGSGAENEKDHSSVARFIRTKRFFPGQLES